MSSVSGVSLRSWPWSVCMSNQIQHLAQAPIMQKSDRPRRTRICMTSGRERIAWSMRIQSRAISVVPVLATGVVGTLAVAQPRDPLGELPLVIDEPGTAPVGALD